MLRALYSGAAAATVEKKKFVVFLYSLMIFQVKTGNIRRCYDFITY